MALIDLSMFRKRINEIQSTMPNGSVTKPEEDENANKKVSYTDDENNPEEQEEMDPESQDGVDYTIQDDEPESPPEGEEDTTENEPVDYTIPDDEELPPEDVPQDQEALPPPDDTENDVPPEDNPEPQADNTDGEDELVEPDAQDSVDYTVPDDTNDSEPQADNTDGEEGNETDYTADINNTDGDTTGGEEGDSPSEPTDYTADGGEETTDTDGETGANGATDYTTDDTGGEDGGDEGDYTGDGSDTSDSDYGSDGEVDNELKQLEDELFSSLTPDQIAIKEKTLKEQFMTLYQTTIDITEKIKMISKTKENSRLLEFVTIKLMELKDLIYFTVTTAYPTKTFIENMTLFQQCLAACNTINQLLQEAIPEFQDKDADKSN